MRHYRFSYLLRPISFLADIFTINLAYISAFYLKFASIQNIFKEPYIYLFWIINISWLCVLFVFKPLNRSRIHFNVSNLIYSYSKLVFYHLTIIFIFLFSTQTIIFSRLFLLYFYALLYFIGIIWRTFSVEIIRIYRVSGSNYRQFIIIGRGELALFVKDYYMRHPELGFKHVSTYSEINLDNPETQILLKHIDYVYCNLSDSNNETIKNLVKFTENYKCEIKLITDFRGFLTHHATIEYHDFIPVISLSKEPHFEPKVELLKRLFDLTFALFALVLTSPALLIITFLIKLEDNGPIIYLSERTGKWGQTFQMIKFRSMVVNSEEIVHDQLNGVYHSQGEKDPRITKIGNFLRKSRLDEIPQFINVIRGEMSVVGPRPLAKYDVDMLMNAEPFDFQRLLTIKPGITSIGQIQQGYSTTVEENISRLRLDLEYLNNYSFLRDIVLIFKTIKVILLNKGK
jgi:exopolysaccharide biosynthesis polyprenyl glycosylphosphotransferase